MSIVEFEPGDIATWATAAQVSLITGKPEADFSQDDIQRAQFVIDIVTGTSVEMYSLLLRENRMRDLKWLRMAVAYQTVWMKARPDFFEAWDIKSLSQDGVSSDFETGSATLAPMARRAIRRLSWKGTRSMRIGFRGYEDEDGALVAGAPVYDEPTDRWEPMY